MPYLYRSFSAKKSPIISGSFAENDLHLKASYGSSPPPIACGSELDLFLVIVIFNFPSIIDNLIFDIIIVALILPADLSCNIFVNDGTGWQRLIGSPKLQIIFHKRATKYGSLLQKMTYEDKGFYESSPPFELRVSLFVCAVLNDVIV